MRNGRLWSRRPPNDEVTGGVNSACLRGLKDRPLWDDGLHSPHTHGDKAARVRRMFDSIAPTYQLVNSVFSVGRDRAWRRRSVALTRPMVSDRVLDIACGTGDLTRAFKAHHTAPGVVVGCDFAHRMLTHAGGGGVDDTGWVQADALSLPFRSGSFTITSCAFGVRNFQDLQVGLSEMYRVLAPGGRAVILEFTRPSNRIWRWVYELYASKIMPAGAALVSGDRTGAYRYLPCSVVSFSDVGAMCRHLRNAGFDTVTAAPMTFGVVTIYVAIKGRDDRARRYP